MKTLNTFELAKDVKQKLYHERIELLRKCDSRIKTNQDLLSECKKYPFISQVLGLTKLSAALTDEEKADAIDAVLTSGVYDRVEEEESKNAPGFNYIDQLVKELLRWFKEEFFLWVNKLGCPQCGNDEQSHIRQATGCRPYKEEHHRGKAYVIERYQCMKCRKVYEFPRYNDIRTLLVTRKGRCGEWNNCFIAILKSLDIDVRYIWNAEDHVWCEYYSEKQRRWIHLDACENSYDQPLLYSSGWGKKMSYVFAIKESYIVDVTNKYLDPNRPEVKLPRDKVPEKYLQTILTYTNANKIISASMEEALTSTSRLIADFRSSRAADGSSPAGSNCDNPMKPRQSGGAEWTEKRGEAGGK